MTYDLAGSPPAQGGGFSTTSGLLILGALAAAFVLNSHIRDWFAARSGAVREHLYGSDELYVPTECELDPSEAGDPDAPTTDPAPGDDFDYTIYGGQKS